MDSRMNIFISGMVPTATSNRGDEAVFMLFCHQIRKHFPNSHITAAVRHPSEEYAKYFDIKAIRNLEYDSKKQSIGMFFRGLNKNDSRGDLEVFSKELGKSDLVVIGGSPFEGISEEDVLHGQAHYAMLLALLALFYNKPYIIYAMKQYPIQDASTRRIAKFVCENAEAVIVREEASKHHLLNAGVDIDNVHVMYDPALGLMPQSNGSLVDDILSRNNIRLNDRPVVGVCFRNIYWRWGEEIFNRYISKMAKICDWMAEEFDAQLLFVPLQTYSVDGDHEDDRYVSNLIIDEMQNKDSAHNISQDLWLWDTLCLFQLTSFVMSNRRHIIAFAALHNVPALALKSVDEEYNLQPFMDSLQLSDEILYFMDNDLNNIKEKIRKSWLKRADTKRHLKQRIPELSTATKEFVNIISNIFKAS